ncbi:unnamed protein product [Sphagnum compactum]
MAEGGRSTPSFHTMQSPKVGGGCASSFFQLFQRNSSKRRFSLTSKRLPAGTTDEEGKRKGFPMPVAAENAQKTTSSDSRAPSPMVVCNKKVPGVVARLMGLESLPLRKKDATRQKKSSQRWSKESELSIHQDTSSRGAWDIVQQQQQPPLPERKDEKQLSIVSSHRSSSSPRQLCPALLPSKSHNQIIAPSPLRSPSAHKGTARLLEAAAKILEPNMQPCIRPHRASSSSSSSHGRKPPSPSPPPPPIVHSAVVGDPHGKNGISSRSGEPVVVVATIPKNKDATAYVQKSKAESRINSYGCSIKASSEKSPFAITASSSSSATTPDKGNARHHQERSSMSKFSFDNQESVTTTTTGDFADSTEVPEPISPQVPVPSVPSSISPNQMLPPSNARNGKADQRRPIEHPVVVSSVLNTLFASSELPSQSTSKSRSKHEVLTRDLQQQQQQQQQPSRSLLASPTEEATIPCQTVTLPNNRKPAPNGGKRATKVLSEKVVKLDKEAIFPKHRVFPAAESTTKANSSSAHGAQRQQGQGAHDRCAAFLETQENAHRKQGLAAGMRMISYSKLFGVQVDKDRTAASKKAHTLRSSTPSTTTGEEEASEGLTPILQKWFLESSNGSAMGIGEGEQPSPVSILDSPFQDEVSITPEPSLAESDRHLDEVLELHNMCGVLGVQPSSQLDEIHVVKARDIQQESSKHSGGSNLLTEEIADIRENEKIRQAILEISKFQTADLHDRLGKSQPARADEEQSFVHGILKAAQFLSHNNEEESSLKWFAPGLPLDPSLFDRLESGDTEQISIGAGGGGGGGNLNLAQMSTHCQYGALWRCDRKLLVDSINEALVTEIGYGGEPKQPWMVNDNILAGSNPTLRPPGGCSNKLVEDIYRTISKWRELASNAIDSLIDMDMNKCCRLGKWRYYEHEIRDISLEIASMLLGMILDEFVTDLAAATAATSLLENWQAS